MTIERPGVDSREDLFLGTSDQSVEPPVRPWTDLGFAPWVQPTITWLRRWARPQLVLAAMVLTYSAVFGWLTWLQQANFGTFDYDMGIFDQEIWLSAHHLDPFVTIRGLDMWANHVNPIIYLLVPFYWLGAGPHLLYVVETLAFGVSAIPLWLLARDRLARPWLALGLPFAWLLYPSVEWMNWWHFHPEYLGIPAFLFAYWFADRERWRWYALCVVIVLACKEDAALPIIALGVLLFFRRKRRAGVLTCGGALAWFLISVEAIIPAATGYSGAFYLYQFSSLGNSIWQILWNIVRHPTRVLNLGLQQDRYRYFAQLFLPILGVALLAPATLFVALPTLIENVTNNQGYTHDIRYQYTSFVAAGIFLAVIEGLTSLRRERVRNVVLTLCAVSLVSNFVWSPSPLDHKLYTGGTWALTASPTVKTLADMVTRVPGDAAVSASYTVVPHLSHRDQIYTFPNPWRRSYYGINSTEPPESPAGIAYLVVDTGTISADSNVLLKTLTGPGGQFRIVEQRDGAVLAQRRS
ncbi:MAG TPA: DUF2079 domain-containing protein [Acidimicrobiales bacterium]|nr:DUF2079 domain-containing protein [Acidimicrobiales bacterium]